MNRYKVTASYKIEQRKGFVVTHNLEKEYKTADELTQGIATFISTYNSEYCHGLDFHVTEIDVK